MKKNKIVYSLLCLTFFILAFQNCEKDENDFRSVYYGYFNFTVIYESWSIIGPTTYDTIKYSGVIRKFVQSDSDSDYYNEDDSKEDPNKKITIEFLKKTILTSVITNDGQLIPKGASHYYHEGGFMNRDTIKFSLTGLGGLGMGTNFYVKGIRK